MAACERAGEWEKALGLFVGLREAGGAADAAVFNAAISAAASSGDVSLTRSLLEEMKAEDGVEVTLRAFNGVLKACERAADWDGALDTLMEMKTAGLKPDKISYTCAIGAAGRAREWEMALSLFTQMEVENVEIDPLAFHTLLRALTAAGQWAVSLHAFTRVLNTTGSSEMHTSTLFASALDACAAGGQRDRALELLQQMRTLRVMPSAACYHGVAASCAAADDWQGALGVLQDMVKQDMPPESETWQIVLNACRKAGRDEEADQLSSYAERVGVPLATLDSYAES
jgi:pentatricopeptide repeat domain-containing protein 1